MQSIAAETTYLSTLDSGLCFIAWSSERGAALGGDEPYTNFLGHCTGLPHMGGVPFVMTDLGSVEMIKYTAKAFLAAEISFINEMANIYELVCADVSSVATGTGLDTRSDPHSSRSVLIRVDRAFRRMF
jgi:UDP-glucose/GDP-mannose dehydrogenase family, central domain